MNDNRPPQELLAGLPQIVPTRSRRAGARAWIYRHAGSLIFVGLPTLLTAIYYGLIAADLYASEARFIVRSPSRVQATSITYLLQGAGISRAQDDVYSVNDFVTSRDAIAALGKHVNLRLIFNRSEADFLARYPDLIYDSSDLDFYRYYKKRVQVVYDTTTGISTVTVKAFRPEDARTVADLLIQESEALVNRLNERARNNAVRDAQTYVDTAEQRVSQAQRDVLAYRTREELLDPTKSSGAIFETAAKLEAEIASTQTRVAEINRNAPDSPLKAGLQTRVGALQQRVRDLRTQLAGPGGSMAPKIPEYEQLILQQEFASKELALAMSSLESVREEARRQSIYLDRIVDANLPDKAEFPKRMISILIVFISCFIAYSTARLLLAGIREHAQD